MTWVVDEENRRIIDQEQGYVLVAKSTGSDGSTKFAIEGRESGCVFFADSPPSSKLNISFHNYDEEMDVWRILSWPDEWRETIKAAMLAFKTSNGWQYPDTKTYVQFGVNGEPEHA